ncbi:Polycomb group RING finger protein 3 [Trichoplax sp. H2]|nr:Polycomb group RING finger protein 3 [Trichoplax sp. H2]|eukprot:RDD40535.1 Polycomb group RING finger protein 3 [Trichoplax sp. H2]
MPLRSRNACIHRRCGLHRFFLKLTKHLPPAMLTNDSHRLQKLPIIDDESYCCSCCMTFRMDRTMQDIVDKFVPWLKEAERERLNKFYIDHGLQNPFTTLTKQDKYRDDRQRENIEKRHDYDYHRSDEQIAICFRCLEDQDKSLLTPIKSLERNFILCSSQITIRHLKKFLIKKLCLPSLDNIIITCNGISVGQSHSMQFVRLTHWLKEPPVVLNYTCI